MKRIEQRKIYHMSNYHKRHFDFQFHRSIILVKKHRSDDAVHKKIAMNSIRSVTIKNEDEQIFSGDGGGTGFKRSRSWLSKVRKDDDEKCKWNFSFELEMSDRTMELFAPTRLEREKWVKVFKAISEMNDKLISPKKVNPLKFLQQ